jgi:hypothetical protein
MSIAFQGVVCAEARTRCVTVDNRPNEMVRRWSWPSGMMQQLLCRCVRDFCADCALDRDEGGFRLRCMYSPQDAGQ